jgi:hypothetical protein
LLLLVGDLLCMRMLHDLQQQNSNLTQELPQLLEDVEPQLQLAEAAFGAPPDAVNLWIGDERAATTFHKDHVRKQPGWHFVVCQLASSTLQAKPWHQQQAAPSASTQGPGCEVFLGFSVQRTCPPGSSG